MENLQPFTSEWIQEKLNNTKMSLERANEWNGIIFHDNIPVMRIDNNHDKDLWNGDMYHVYYYDIDFVYFKRERDDRKIHETWFEFLKNYNPCYAMTCHKIIGTNAKFRNVGVHECNNEQLKGYHGWFYTSLSRTDDWKQNTIFDIF
jgi:hypothetical protein